MVASKKNITLNNTTWKMLIDEVSTVFRLTKEEKNRIAISPAARLSAEIAYLSRCNDPDRVALSRIGTIVMAMKTPLGLHRPGESLYNRIALLDHYPGGEPEIVKAGTILLQLISLYDHRRDLEDDEKNGKLNPLSHELCFEEEKSRLMEAYSCLSAKTQELYKMFTDFLPYASWWS